MSDFSSNAYSDTVQIRKYVGIVRLGREKVGDGIGAERNLALIEATRMGLKTDEGRSIFQRLISLWPDFTKVGKDQLNDIGALFDELYQMDPSYLKKAQYIQSVGGYTQGMADAYSIFVENRLPEDLAYIKHRREEINRRINEIKAQNTILEDQVTALNRELLDLTKENKSLKVELSHISSHLGRSLGYDQKDIERIKNNNLDSFMGHGK